MQMVVTIMRKEGHMEPQTDYPPASTNSKDARVPQVHFGLLDVPLPEAYWSDQNKSKKPIEEWRSAWRHNGEKVTRSDEDSAQQRKARSALSDENDPAHSLPPIRPKAKSITQSSGLKRPRSADQRMHIMPMGAAETSHMEGSATSDDNNHSRLIPRRGAGPDLRNEGGGVIDEYLMRLLNMGNPNNEADKKSGEGHRLGSRLGPLAPGAGLIPRPAPQTSPTRRGATKAAAYSKAAADTPTHTPSHPTPLQELPRESLATQPTSNPDSNTEPLQKSWSTQIGEQKTPHNGGPTAAVGRSVPSFSGLAAGPQDGLSNSDLTQIKLGPSRWKHIRTVMLQQQQEFGKQLAELHRVASLQEQLNHQMHSALGQPSASYQPSSYVPPRSPDYTVRQNSRGLKWPDSANDNLNSAGNLASAGNTEAATWPVYHQKLSGSYTGIRQKSEPPAKAISRTTQMAIDAQRRRRRSKAVGHSISSKGIPATAPLPVHTGPAAAPAEPPVQEAHAAANDTALRSAQLPPQSPMGSLPNPETWSSIMQQHSFREPRAAMNQIGNDGMQRDSEQAQPWNDQQYRQPAPKFSEFQPSNGLRRVSAELNSGSGGAFEVGPHV